MAGNKKRVLSSAAHYGFYLLISALMCGITQQYSMGIMTSWVEGHTITGNDIRTVQVRTKHECALHCVSDASCAAAAVYCKLPVGSETFNCELKFGSNLLTYTIVNNSDMCYSIVQSRGEYINGVSVNDISTTSPAVTTTTTIPTTTVSGSAKVRYESGIRAGIGNLNNMCSGSSSVDIALITDDGVYLYDDMGSLTTGACSGPQAITTIFSGYSGGKALPSVSDIICLMVHQNNDIDMFDSKYTHIPGYGDGKYKVVTYGA
ncbi:uncharacterized protein LOC132554007 [Ylistrum balloti]|uniref:uncharacterized protein LOC132554007 n=1 Tax=Ylistrum balloti TaxID=509963 RepID=UPI00290596D2|nr:uncharacterized protein LOC132554007 [Ylistrum balloti]